ncbi:MAG: hypothetical protein LBK59_12100, partial [Bifidobacteriaceae bacterium]|nr:hypothetical protein [Bifidobacteriaceae bacterium]
PAGQNPEVNPPLPPSLPLAPVAPIPPISAGGAPAAAQGRFGQAGGAQAQPWTVPATPDAPATWIQPQPEYPAWTPPTPPRADPSPTPPAAMPAQAPPAETLPAPVSAGSIAHHGDPLDALSLDLSLPAFEPPPPITVDLPPLPTLDELLARAVRNDTSPPASSTPQPTSPPVEDQVPTWLRPYLDRRPDGQARPTPPASQPPATQAGSDG